MLQTTAAFPGIWLHRSQRLRPALAWPRLAALAAVFCVLRLSGIPAVYATPLLGDTGATNAAPDGAAINPANAGYIDHNQVYYAPEIIKQETLDVRYPGFSSSETSQVGLGNVFTLPVVTYKFAPDLGISGYIVPPLGLGTDIHASRVPVIILGSQNDVDFSGKGTVDTLADVEGGYRVNDRIGVGIGMDYSAVNFTATLTPTDGGAVLANVAGNMTAANMKLGVRYEVIPKRLTLGAAVGLFHFSKTQINTTSPLIPGGGGAGSSAQQSTQPLSSLVLGVGASFGARVRLLTDLVYTRANPAETSFSLVELKEKARDVHDTLAVRSGLEIHLLPGTEAMLGLRYEPASLGEGGTGSGSLAGFGTLELLQIFAGLADLTPYYQFAAGAAYSFARTMHGYYQWTVALGLVYRRASLGIDASGELPGAYLDKRTSIPVAVTYKI